MIPMAGPCDRDGDLAGSERRRRAAGTLTVRDRISAEGASVVALKSNTKATRADWLAVAREVLVSDGVDQVKILSLGERLGVSRSSFYWYFSSRKSLLDALLDGWEQANTQAIVAATAAPADTITGAVCNLFRCFLDARLFDPQLDFAIREWSRRSARVRRIVDQADEARLAAIAGMFERQGYAGTDAEVRARTLYYMQLGYYALELHEPLEKRLSLVPAYLETFTGKKARPKEIAALVAYARANAGPA